MNERSLLFGFAALVLAASACAAEERRSADVRVPRNHARRAEGCGKTCRPQCEIRTRTRVVYGCKREHVCLPSCSIWSLFGKECGCVQCGEPRAKRTLLKKIIPEEECGVKCVVVPVPRRGGCCNP
ncbi:MAG: hypothetical protein N2C14_15655 [Planctomycetales bacterium]